jgi:hypothetical protein
MGLKTMMNRVWVGAGLVMALAACGGGGDGGEPAGPTLLSPPATAATLAVSTTEAQEAVKAALGGGQTVVTRAKGLDSSFFLIGNPLGAGSVHISLAGRAVAAARERALAVQSIGCAQVFGTTACTGSITIDSNINGSSTVVPAGGFVAMSFNGLSGLLGGSAFSMNGSVRIDFLTAFDTAAASPVNTGILITTSNVSGSAGGVSFGPDSSLVLIEIDAAGVAAVTVDGVRITGLDGVTITDAENYRISGTTLRRAYWAGASAYIDASFSNWVVVGGRPQAGSTVTVSAGTSSVAIAVTNSSSTTVVYDVLITVGGAATRYSVTATYPAGGGAPSYTVQSAG